MMQNQLVQQYLLKKSTTLSETNQDTNKTNTLKRSTPTPPEKPNNIPVVEIAKNEMKNDEKPIPSEKSTNVDTNTVKKSTPTPPEKKGVEKSINTQLEKSNAPTPSETNQDTNKTNTLKRSTPTPPEKPNNITNSANVDAPVNEKINSEKTVTAEKLSNTPEKQPQKSPEKGTETPSTKVPEQQSTKSQKSKKSTPTPPEKPTHLTTNDKPSYTGYANASTFRTATSDTPKHEVKYFSSLRGTNLEPPSIEEIIPVFNKNPLPPWVLNYTAWSWKDDHEENS